VPRKLQTFPIAPAPPAAAPGRGSVIAATVCLVLAAALSSGCSAGSSPTKAVSGWFGDGDKAAAQGGVVFYAGSSGLNVHSEAKASSPVVGRLSAGEKVVRKTQKDGFAQVEARRGAVKGWVVNSRLLSRPPAARTAAGAKTSGDSVAPAASSGTDEALVENEPESVAPAASESAEPNEAAAPAAPNPEAKGIGASVFDPY